MLSQVTYVSSAMVLSHPESTKPEDSEYISNTPIILPYDFVANTTAIPSPGTLFISCGIKSIAKSPHPEKYFGPR